MGAAGRCLIQEQYNWEAKVQTQVDYYDKILSQVERDRPVVNSGEA
jgi:hypothetical protein